MFDWLYAQSVARARQRDGPLAEDRARFLTHLSHLGLSHKTLQRIAELLLVVADTLDLANRPGESITRDEIRQKATDTRHYFISVATRWLRFLGRLEQPTTPAGRFAGEIEAFADHLRQHRGLSPTTIHDRCQIVRRLLERVAAPDAALGDVTVNQIDAALLGLIGQGGYARRTLQGWASHLRTFFRYAAARRWCRGGLAEAIQGPPVFAQASLPQGPSWDDVRRLLTLTEGDRPAAIRDRAVLMLLAVYGLRSGEVRHLRLEDFDWGGERLRVWCPKTKRERTYPLVRPVGDAVLRYLREVRPQSQHRVLFLTLLAPVRPLRHLWDIVGKRLRGLGVTSPHLGPHALRHACATHLLAEGFTLKQIGDHLGHRQPDTTRIYAKVDLAGLRQVADVNLEGLL
jgi:site-specific recombinase XerD